MLIPWLLGAHGWDWRAVWVVLGALGLLAQLLVEPPLRLAERSTATIVRANSAPAPRAPNEARIGTSPQTSALAVSRPIMLRYRA